MYDHEQNNGEKNWVVESYLRWRKRVKTLNVKTTPVFLFDGRWWREINMMEREKVVRLTKAKAKGQAFF